MTQKTTSACEKETDIEIINNNLEHVKDAVTIMQNDVTDMKKVMNSFVLIEQQVTNAMNVLIDQGNRVRSLELDWAAYKGSNKWVEKVVLIIVSAGIGFLLSSKGGGL